MVGVRGQGRRFDTPTALTKAMEIFWRNGYEGASISELTKAMGITASSLYAAFGGKRQLFDMVVEHYLDTKGRFMGDIFNEEKEALPLIRRLLFEAAEKYAEANGPGGCFISSAAVCATEANRDVERKLEDHRISNIKRIEDVVRSSIKKGDVVADVNAEALAGFVGTVLQGMAQRGRDGASAEDLRSTADMAYAYVEIVTHTFVPRAV